jgi:hypothetical protein
MESKWFEYECEGKVQNLDLPAILILIGAGVLAVTVAIVGALSIWWDYVI